MSAASRPQHVPEGLPGRLFQTVPGFEDHLAAELGPPERVLGETRAGSLWLYDNHSIIHKQSFWNLNTWLEPFELQFDSISEAVRALREIQRNWAPLLFTCFRRGALIAEKLPSLSVKPKPFPWDLPDTPVGAFTLLDEHTLIASASCSSPFPGGIIEFAEDKEGPPSRAYLKLWEALTRARKRPLPGERCLDAGASPGGWTWALARLGAKVIAVDRAPLDLSVAGMTGADGEPLVSFIKHDAFTLRPEDIGPLDWLFCDVACYPGRLLSWLEKWLVSGLCRNYVCTIKMQGRFEELRESFETVRKFAAVPGSQILHLWHNKHELTWFLLSR
jgi:23S rRNA (cytidine2498-2'-O)-methyltransferase